MRKQDRQEVETTIGPRLWTYAEAIRALPYLRAIARSLREHWLEMQQARQQIRRMDARPGGPNRQTLFLREEAIWEAELAKERFVEALRELMVLNVFCREPVKGLVLVPWQEGDDVAWFVFDLFAPQRQEFSRFYADPLETQRSLVERLDPS